MIDAQTRLPVPPIELHYTDSMLTAGSWIAWISYAVILLALLYSLHDWKQNKTFMFITLVLGGAMDALVEPIVDITGGCWHPIIGQPTLFEIMGRPMPYWVPAVYASFYGALGAVIYRLCRGKGMSKRSMWVLFAACLIAEPLAEGGMLLWNMYAYYGNQPLWIAGFPPLWWIPANIVAIYMTGLSAVVVDRQPWRWLMVPIIVLVSPLSDVAFTSLVGFPSMVAVNSHFPYWVEQLCGIASFVIAFFVMWAVIRTFAADSPSRASPLNH